MRGRTIVQGEHYHVGAKHSHADTRHSCEHRGCKFFRLWFSTTGAWPTSLFKNKKIQCWDPITLLFLSQAQTSSPKKLIWLICFVFASSSFLSCFACVDLLLQPIRTIGLLLRLLNFVGLLLKLLCYAKFFFQLIRNSAFFSGRLIALVSFSNCFALLLHCPLSLATKLYRSYSRVASLRRLLLWPLYYCVVSSVTGNFAVTSPPRRGNAMTEIYYYF